MNIGLYQSAASLSALERWQDAVAQNITASQVPGYKKRTVEFSGVNMGEVRTDAKSKDGNGLASVFPKASYGINFQNGETTPTRRDLDVAVQGEGFLEVQLPDGSKGYTRAGALQLRTDRTLVGSNNMPVLSEGGSSMSMLETGGEVRISTDGSITQGTSSIGKLAVVKFADTSKLVPIGGGVFLTPTGNDPVPVEKPEVLQGYLEGSNVTPLREMVSLIQISRAYEANQKVLTSRDQSAQKALESLG
jgi:flagellar basal body rod protein FlgG